MSLASTHAAEVRQFRNLALSYIDQATVTDQPASPEQFLLYRYTKAEWTQASLPTLPFLWEVESLSQNGRNIHVVALYTQGINAELALVCTNQDKTPGDYTVMANVDPLTGELKGDHASLHLASASSSGGLYNLPQEAARAAIEAIFDHHAGFAGQAHRLSLADTFRLGLALQAAEPGVKTTSYETIRKRLGNPQTALTLSIQAANRAHSEGQPSRLQLSLSREFPSAANQPSGHLVQELTLVTAANDNITVVTRTSRLYDQNIVIKDYGNGPVPMAVPEKTLVIPSRFTRHVYPDDQPTLGDLNFFARLVTGPVWQSDFLA